MALEETKDKSLEEIAEELQARIMEDLKKKYTPKVIDYWQRPRNWGIMSDADGYGKVTGVCGDTMEISIQVCYDRIMKCTFDTDGCGTSIACASAVTDIAMGKTIDEARSISKKTVLDFLGGLPEEDRHCASLAAQTLIAAIRDFRDMKRAPWKKIYRVK
jgi:nitrogen fixation NifU-like protein